MSTTTEIEISIDEFESLSDFLSLNVVQRTNVIKLGMNIQKYSTKYELSQTNKVWEKELISLKDKHSQEIDSLTKECSSLKKNLREQQEQFSEDKSTLASSIRENAYTTFKTEVNALTERNNELQNKIHSLSSELQSKFDNTMKEWRHFYEEKMNRQTKEFEQIRSSYEDKISQFIIRSQNSTMRGQDGEEQLYLVLNSLFPTALIEDTHTIPGRGDFIVNQEEITMMVETKNYSRNVQKSEVDKFYRDIECSSNSDVKCGVLVSMNCGIASKDDFSLEVRNGKPIMFLHNIKDNYEHIRLAMEMFKMIITQSTMDLSNVEVKGKLSNIAKLVKRNFQIQKKLLDKYYKDQDNALTQQQNSIIELFSISQVKY